MTRYDIFEEGFCPPPPSGYIKEIAEALHVDIRTVRSALRSDTVSSKIMEVREAYMRMYVEPHMRKDRRSMLV